MKKFFAEFKKFISRGNVMDMAVGMIIGGAFTTIVTALANGILKPLINFAIYKCLGGNSLDDAFTFLVRSFQEDGTLDLANSIYIDWGAFIAAIINFLLIALVLFLIVKVFNSVKDSQNMLSDVTKRAEMKKDKGLKLSKREQQALDNKAKVLAEQEEAERKASEEANKPDPVIVLLQEIRDQLKTK